MRRSCPRGLCEHRKWQLSRLVWMRRAPDHSVPMHPASGTGRPRKLGGGTWRRLGGRGGPGRPRAARAWSTTNNYPRTGYNVANCQYTHPTSHAITAAPTKRPRTLRVLQPAVVTVTDGSAWTPVATLLYFRKGQTWFALIWPQREQRYFFVSPPVLLDLRDGAGETLLTLSGSTKSGSAAFVGFRRRPVLRAAREGLGFGAGAGGGGGICGIALSSSSRSKESNLKPSPRMRGCVASSI